MSISFVPVCWSSLYSFSIPSFRSVELKLFSFLQLEAFSCLSIPFLPPYWIDFVAFFQLEIFLPEIISSILLNWIHCFLSARSLFVREHFLRFILLNWVHCILSAFLPSVLLNWNYSFFQLEASSFLHFLSWILLNYIRCFLSAWNILSEIISLFPSCWIEFIAFFQLEACLSVSISFVSYYWIEFIVFFQHSFFLFCWIEIITFFQLEASSFLHFLSSILLNWLRCFLSTWKIFVWHHFLFSIQQASGWKKAMRSIQQNGRKQNAHGRARF